MFITSVLMNAVNCAGNLSAHIEQLKRKATYLIFRQACRAARAIELRE
jgi:hypothetical protein